VKNINPYSFYECSNLRYVVYLGNTTQNEYCFSKCTSLDHVCVSSNYNSSSFCKQNKVFTPEQCADFRRMENKCFHVKTQSNKTWNLTKDDEVIQWENHSNGCVSFYCDNSSGLHSESSCYSSGSQNKYCMNGINCRTDKFIGKPFIVVVDVENASLPGQSTVEILGSLSTALKKNPYFWSLGTEMNKEGKIHRVLVYVNDITTAKSIQSYVMSYSHSDSCKCGILCNSTKVEIVEDPNPFKRSSNSCASSGYGGNIIVFMSLLMLFISMLIN